MIKYIFFLLLCLDFLYAKAKYSSDNTTVYLENECDMHGGIKKGCGINGYANSDVSLNAIEQSNFSANISLAGIVSKQPSANYIGDFQTASNIDAPSQLLLYNAYISYEPPNGSNLNVSAGIIDANVNYDATSSSSYLINSSFGISAGLSANSSFSIYPVPGYAVSSSVDMNQNQIQMGVFDANPAKRNNPFSNGALFIAQWQRERAGDFSVFLGSWCDNSYNALTQGFYGSFAKTIDNKATFFLRAAVSNGAATVVPLGIETGVMSQSFIPKRDKDIISAGIAQARFKNGSAETAYEATYIWHQNSTVSFQPDFQYIHDISGTTKDAYVGIFRLIFTLGHDFLF